MRRRRTAKEKELEDNSRLLRLWHRHHREQLAEALAGVHGAVVERVMAQLEDLRTARELVAALEAEDWSAVDDDTRFTVLHEIDCAISKLRERRGLPAFDDPLNDQPENAFRIIKHLFESFPPVRGSEPRRSANMKWSNGYE
jgi:hypothetical protein